ncbi:extracellular solute-binding protein [Salinifilum ghardaiensis]
MTRRSLLGWAAAGALGAAGCAGSREPAPRSFRWQAIPSFSLQATTEGIPGYLREALRRYQHSSGWRVLPEISSSDITAAMAKLLLQASQGRAPEVAAVDSYVFPRFADYARDLGGAVDRAGIPLQDWYPQFRAVMTAGGGPTRALQFTTDVRVLYYRKDLVPEPPASWEEVFAVGRRLAARGKTFQFCGGRSESGVNTALWPQYWSQGGRILAPDGSPAFASGPGRQAMIDSLAYLRRLITEGISPQRIATMESEDDVNPEVVAGRVGMFLGGSWQAADLQDLLTESDFAAEWDIAPIPSRSGEDHASVAGGWTWACFAEEPEVLRRSTAFVIDAFVDDAAMARWCTLGGYLPPRTSVYEHPDYAGDAFTSRFREHLARYARARPLQREYQQVSTAMQTALSSVLSLEAEPEAAVDAALAQIV